MKIQFKKKKNQKHVLHCTRPDGTSTWQVTTESMIFHDLAHYAVETVLGLRESFYSLLADGMDISDFEGMSKEQKASIAVEAIHTEFIINLLQVEFWNQNQPLADFNEQLITACLQQNFPAPHPIDAIDLNAIRTRLKELVYQWNELAIDQHLDLNWN